MIIGCRILFYPFIFQASNRTCQNINSFVNLKTNSDILTANWRPINLEKQPFNLPKPQLSKPNKEPALCESNQPKPKSTSQQAKQIQAIYGG